jgi:hypothetical protein
LSHIANLTVSARVFKQHLNPTVLLVCRRDEFSSA